MVILMFTIKETYKTEIIINKSVFICTLMPINDGDHANELLKDIRKQYYDATHNCYAYVYGLNGEYARCSDDGEPSQTAGVVILDVLKKNNLTNVLAVVTRYFGGIKLGAGGLVRAYSSSTSESVKAARIYTIEKCSHLTITVSYQNYNVVNKVFEGIEPIDKVFTENITLKFLIPSKLIPDLITRAKDITKNQLIYTIEDDTYVSM